MNDFPIPPFPLWSKVGFKKEVWTVAGFHYRQGYQVFGWDYKLVKPFKTDSGSEYLAENCTTTAARDDELTSVQALLEERQREAGKYAAVTQRIAKEAQAEFESLCAQVKG